LRLVRDGSALPGLVTPMLFPVACLVTSTTARGGGLWKYLLHANKQHGLMRRNMPIMVQVLHFLDFRVSPQAIAEWRTRPLRDTYNMTHQGLNYNAPLFLDSGGFKLLFNTRLDLSAYGIPDYDGTGRQARDVLRLQRDLGGDIVATLDYPLPPGLNRNEAHVRMQKSQANAYEAARCLATEPEFRDYTPLLFVAVHGWDRESIRNYVKQIFSDMKHNGLADVPFGIAIGSLVPLRGSKKYIAILEIVRGAIEGIPPSQRASTPVHVFGITGNMISLLVYLGVDTFDSTTYAQEARSLNYFHPQTHQKLAVLEMDELPCQCPICRDLDLEELHESLTSEICFRKLPSGHFKSKYYADIALHNLFADQQLVHQAREAVASGNMLDYIVEQVQRFPGLHDGLDALAGEDYQLRQRLGRKVFRTGQRLAEKRPQLPLFEMSGQVVSMRYTPESFNILTNAYPGPSPDKRILLIIPCSGGKPYSKSRSHRLIAQRLQGQLGDEAAVVHKVTLSGLYGPVPEECEEEEAVIGYDFRLDPRDDLQIILLTDRIERYLERYGKKYEAWFGYATSLAYRTVLERIAERHPRFELFPRKPKVRRLTEFYRQTNIEELMQAIAKTLSKDNNDERLDEDSPQAHRT
jgi:7-cyano-7-deazaguanine tRNA-ribosyltransferase